jgi:hypothetical protein
MRFTMSPDRGDALGSVELGDERSSQCPSQSTAAIRPGSTPCRAVGARGLDGASRGSTRQNQRRIRASRLSRADASRLPFAAFRSGFNRGVRSEP